MITSCFAPLVDTLNFILMDKNILLFVLGLLLFSSAMSAQDIDLDDIRIISDQMTKDSVQNSVWRTGQYPYSARPKNALELGIHVGSFQINGDIPSGSIISPFGIGLHIRKAINYYFSWRLDGIYAKDQGLDGRRTPINVLALDNPNLGDQLITQYGEDGNAFRNYSARNLGASFNLILNIGNLLFHKPKNKWNYYTGVGLGIMNAKVQIDYFDGNGAAYDWGPIGDIGAPNTKEKRSSIREVLDGDYESSFENERDVPGLLNDSGKWFPQFSGIVGISRKFSRRFNLSLEHQILAQDYDKLDGHEWRTTVDQTNDSDIIHYTSLRLGINLGKFDKRTEPLYWVNPYEAALTDIAALKTRPELDLTDSDADGVIDMLDAEPDTPVGCPVDTKGVTLDSDGDGIADCEDPEIYSPPGYKIENGIAEIPEPEILTQDDVIKLIGENAPRPTVVEAGCGKWFLPMIHFDLNMYNIKPDFYGRLHHVATVMQQCPDICVTAYGHTDSRASDDYNQALSFKRSKAAIDYLTSNYNIDRNRLKLMYGGETSPLNATAGSSSYMMNRRVEFRLCADGDSNMGEPEGAIKNVGSGVKFRGNKNSGY